MSAASERSVAIWLDAQTLADPYASPAVGELYAAYCVWSDRTAVRMSRRAFIEALQASGIFLTSAPEAGESCTPGLRLATHEELVDARLRRLEALVLHVQRRSRFAFCCVVGLGLLFALTVFGR